MTTFYDSLPKTLRDELARSPRGGTYDPVPPHVRELIAEAALTCGITAKGPILAYVVRRLRNGLNLGDYPTPPDLRTGEGEWLDGRLRPILEELRGKLGADQAGKGARLNVNPNGYTNPDNVVTLDDHRQGPAPRTA